MELTAEQKKIANTIIEFTMTGRGYIAVAGYAGTGKTTVLGLSAAKLLELRPNIGVAFCAPTGKAVDVLKGKLLGFKALNQQSRVCTVHSLLYVLDKKKSKGGEMHWKMRRDNNLQDISLLVVDEASMVTQRMFEDIMSLRIPTIFIGDSGQLPPVNDNLFQPLMETDLVLSTVHRQALENPIVKFATDICSGNTVPFVRGHNFTKLHKRSSDGVKIASMFMEKATSSANIILCGKNRTRGTLNAMTRSRLGFMTSGPLPQEGEKVLCLGNNRDLDVYNGQLFHVRSSAYSAVNASCYNMSLDNGIDLVAFTGALGATDSKTIGQKLAKERPDISACMASSFQEEPALFDYGYACSVHKAQGSEWENVLLYDERNQYMSDDEYQRWLYTGVTRAKHKLCILSD